MTLNSSAEMFRTSRITLTFSEQEGPFPSSRISQHAPTACLFQCPLITYTLLVRLCRNFEFVVIIRSPVVSLLGYQFLIWTHNHSNRLEGTGLNNVWSSGSVLYAAKSLHRNKGFGTVMNDLNYNDNAKIHRYYSDSDFMECCLFVIVVTVGWYQMKKIPIHALSLFYIW